MAERMNGEQLSLFADLMGVDESQHAPTWDDVQKKLARTVTHEPYTRPCRASCLWFPSISNGRCYLFAKPVIDGMCPATTRLEWT